LAATKLIGSKASTGAAGHPRPTCPDSGGRRRRINRPTGASVVSGINRYWGASATQSAPSAAALIYWWGSQPAHADVFIFSAESLMERRGTMLVEALDNVTDRCGAVMR